MSSIAAADGIRIRPLTELDDFARCVELQDAVWGYDIPNMVTQKVFLLASHIGGQVLGAFDGETLIAYAMSLPGVREGHAYLHSHHLAVLSDYRDRGIGRRLKLAQRDDALARGFDLMEWTFDPLEIRNAYLNIAKLGAIVRRYRRNFYGDSTSPLHGGLPTDRVFAEWWIRSDRVRETLAGRPPAVNVITRIDVPAAIATWKTNEDDREKARALQARNAIALESAFAAGLAVIGYERTATGGRFLLGPPPDRLTPY